tara:strand:+ start:487 stop:669 length:183 start_codon:yes stop_codon:yes gene_type:complete
MPKTKKNRIIPEETLNRNDPIQARMCENILIIKSKSTKNTNTKRNNKIKPMNTNTKKNKN